MHVIKLIGMWIKSPLPFFIGGNKAIIEIWFKLKQKGNWARGEMEVKIADKLTTCCWKDLQVACFKRNTSQKNAWLQCQSVRSNASANLNSYTTFLNSSVREWTEKLLILKAHFYQSSVCLGGHIAILILLLGLCGCREIKLITQEIFSTTSQ